MIQSMTGWWVWAAFAAFIAIMLAVDLFVRGSVHKVSMKEAAPPSSSAGF